MINILHVFKQFSVSASYSCHAKEGLLQLNKYGSSIIRSDFVMLLLHCIVYRSINYVKCGMNTISKTNGVVTGGGSVA